MSMPVATTVFVVSVMAIPTSYLCNYVLATYVVSESLIIAALAIGIQMLAGCLIFCLTRNHLVAKSRMERISFYSLSMFAFNGVFGLIAALELDGIICGFMKQFLKYGEDHLRSGYGVYLSYWYGSVLFLLTLTMITAISWTNDFRNVALYWLGSLINSLLVLTLGILSSKKGPNYCCLLYVPYLLLPLLVGRGIFNDGASGTESIDFQTQLKKRIWTKEKMRIRSRSCRSVLKDVLILTYFLACIGVALLRAMAVMGSEALFVREYVQRVEPYLESEDPAPFPRVQMLIYLFYFVPFYIICIWNAVSPKENKNGWAVPRAGWLGDLCVFVAGAAAQAQFCHIGASVHNRTPYVMRVPAEPLARFVFWCINLGFLGLGPQFFAASYLEEADWGCEEPDSPSAGEEEPASRARLDGEVSSRIKED